MRNRRIVIGVVVAATAVLALTGCVQPSPHVIPTSDPSAAPVFASDAAALAAAKKAFTGYLLASDSIAHDGGGNVDALVGLDSPSQLERDKKTFATLHAAGEHTSGQSNFSHFKLQSNESTGRGEVEIIAYACIDISNTKLLDQEGNPIDSSRPSGAPLVLTFKNASSGSKSLVLDGSVTWQGQDFCS
jgi:hypothetical protein